MKEPVFHPALDPDLLAAQAGGLRRLALAILRDPYAAEEVVQESFARALRAPAPAGPGLVGWLRTVVRGLARNRLRDDQRRRAREAEFVRQREHELHADDSARSETLRAVVDAVLLLDEPYRRVVWAHYFEGLDPTHIAAREGIAVATVGTRLKRARAVLRTRLERRLGHQRGGLGGALAIFAGVGELPLRRDGLLGGMGATKKLGLAAALLLVGWFLWSKAAPSQDAGGADGTELAGERSVSPLRREPLGSERRDEDPARLAAAGETADAQRRAAAASFRGRARREPEWSALQPRERGAFQFRLQVEALDAQGHPLPGAQVVGAPRNVALNELGFTDAKGLLELDWRGFRDGPRLVLGLVHRELGASPLVEVTLTQGQLVRAVLPLQRQAVSVKLPGASPAELLRFERESRLALEEERLKDELDPLPERLPFFSLDAQGNGVFRDPYLLVASRRAALLETLRRSREMQARADTQRIETENYATGKAGRGRLDWGRVKRAAGDAAREREWVELLVEISDPEHRRLPAVPISISVPDPALRFAARTDTEGRAHFRVPADLPLQLVCGGGTLQRSVEELEVPRSGLRLERELETGQHLELRFAGPPEQAPDWTVEAWSADAPWIFGGQARCGPDGKALLALPTPGPWHVLARRRTAANDLALRVAEFAFAGRTPDALTFADPGEPGSLRVSFARASGPSLDVDPETTFEFLEHGGQPSQARLWDPRTGQGLALAARADLARAQGQRLALEFVAPELRSGIFTLEAGGAGQRWVSFGEVRIVPGKALDLGMVPFPQEGRLRVFAQLEREAVEAELELSVRRDGMVVQALGRKLRGRVDFLAQPGEAELWLRYVVPAPPAEVLEHFGTLPANLQPGPRHQRRRLEIASIGVTTIVLQPEADAPGEGR